MISPVDSVDSFSRMPPSLQPAPASFLPAAHAVSPSLPSDNLSTNTGATEESRSESESLSLPDYLILSDCETGRPRHTRYARVRVSARLWKVHHLLWRALSRTQSPCARPLRTQQRLLAGMSPLASSCCSQGVGTQEPR